LILKARCSRWNKTKARFKSKSLHLRLSKVKCAEMKKIMIGPYSVTCARVRELPRACD